MIESGKLIEKIVQDLNCFRAELKSNAKLGLLNQNIHSENLIKKILNIIYDTNLEPLNKLTSNFPGIDLADFDKKIAFQITTEKTSKKINETLGICTKYQNLLKLDTVKIFILSEKQKLYSVDKRHLGNLMFDPKTDIMDFDDVYLEIKNLTIDKLKSLTDLIAEELPHLTNQKDLFQTDLPILNLSFDKEFKVNLSNEEVEQYLYEAFFNLENGNEDFHILNIEQEGFFLDKLKKLELEQKSVSIRREIIEIKEILSKFQKIKKEISLKVQILFKLDKYPLTNKNTKELTISLREIIEVLSYPYYLIEETAFASFFSTRLPREAKKTEGRYKLDVFKEHRSGETLGCSLWVDKEEILRIKQKTSFFRGTEDDEFIKNLLFFHCEVSDFSTEILIEKLIPSFVDRFYDFRYPPYNFIEQDDFSTWTDMPNYLIGLG